MPNILGFVGIGVTGAVLLCAILAAALNFWMTRKSENTEVAVGLWEFCAEVLGAKSCTDIDSKSVSDNHWKHYQAVRAMVLLGVLLAAGAIVAGILVMFVMKNTKLLFFVAAGLDIAAVSDNHWKHYQAVRAMVLLGVLLAAGAIVAGILVMFVMKNTKLLFFVAAGLDIAAVSDNHWKHYQAVRAMVLLGVLLAAGAIVAGILVMFVMKNTKLLFFVAAGLDIAAVSDNHWKHYQAVRAMVLLGVLMAAGAIVAGILVMFVMKNTKLLFFVAAGLDIAAGLFLMTAMAIFVDQLHVDSFDYGAAFALDIIAWIGAWVAGGLFVGAKIMDKDRISHI